MKIYCTARNPASATIRFEDNESRPFEGSVRGPFCNFSRTLPATVPIRDGMALMVDPCYWTPKLPFRYQVTLKSPSDESTSHQFMWGIRWCVPHQRNLFVDGKGYVVRAATWDDRFELEAFRELSCAVLIKTPVHEGIYQRASEIGVLIIDTSPDAGNFNQILEPSVHFYHRESSSMPSGVPRSDALPMARIQNDGTFAEGGPAPVCVKADDPVNGMSNGLQASVGLADESFVAGGNAAKIACPLFVERRIEREELADMRRACDRLQRDVAPHGQFAGYLVSDS